MCTEITDHRTEGVNNFLMDWICPMLALDGIQRLWRRLRINNANVYLLLPTYELDRSPNLYLTTKFAKELALPPGIRSE